MQFYFKAHKDDPLVSKGVVAGRNHIVFEVRNGVAEIPDPPDIDKALSGKAKARATKRRQGEIEAIREAVREIGGVPNRDEGGWMKAEGKGLADTLSPTEKSSKGGKK